MENYKIIYSPIAKDDLFGIYSYIAIQLTEPQIARKQINRIRSAVRSLESMPSRNAKVNWEPWLSQGMRKMPVNNYVVFYFVDESNFEVRIVRIVYGGRDLRKILHSDSTDTAPEPMPGK